MSTKKFIIKIDPTDLVPKTSARLFYYGGFALIVIQIAMVVALWKHIPRVVPLFFTEPWGEARLAPKILLLIIPTLSLGSLAVNLMVSKGTKEASALLSYTLGVASALLVIMFTIALAGILQSVI